jgi:hypothetical protein
MAVGYERKATPPLTFECSFGEWQCFRIHCRSVDALSGLMYKGEVIEFLLKAPHKIGNSIPGFNLPENQGRKDVFVLVERDGIPVLRHGFDITGFAPDLVQ